MCLTKVMMCIHISDGSTTAKSGGVDVLPRRNATCITIHTIYCLSLESTLPSAEAD